MFRRRFVILITLFCFFVPSVQFSAYAGEEAVRVLSFQGEVKIFSPGSDKDTGCAVDKEIKAGDRIKTGEASHVEIAFDKQKMNIIRIEENSDVVVVLKGNEKIELANGMVYARLAKLPKGETFQVRTPCVVCGVRGTGWLTKTDQEETTVSTFENKVFVNGLKENGEPMEKTFWINEGYERRIKKFENPEKISRISDERLSKMREIMNIRKEVSQGESSGTWKKMDRAGEAESNREKQEEGKILKRDDKKLDEVRNKEEVEEFTP